MSMLFFLKPLWPARVDYRAPEGVSKKKKRKVFKVTGDKFDTRATEIDYLWMAKNAVETKKRKQRQQREDEEMLHVLNLI